MKKTLSKGNRKVLQGHIDYLEALQDQYNDGLIPLAQLKRYKTIIDEIKEDYIF